ncbi:Hypothetical predicted protein [Lecanosticta acicola]|uniref:Autophagy-related protein 29 n=1 Tax=Lecanosticta acicola TaxID=111012 RepID=A0AAI8W2C3_9PEZI|nr:Hypothetical predicted protein [Lecanosticta acicola]
MSPSSSAQPLTESGAKDRSRHNSLQEPARLPKPSSRPGSPSFPMQTVAQNSPHYTVFIRLPFKRGEFQDPPPVEWDATKDRRLWKLISSGKGELNWEGLSQDFGVELSFLLMQAAWLNERHVDRIRKQVGRLPGINTAGETTGSAIASAVGGSKTEIIAAKGGNETSSPGTSTPQPQQSRVPISRTPSAVTVTQSKLLGSTTTTSRRRRPNPITTSHSPKEAPLDSSDSSSESEPPSAIQRSQAFRRPPIASRSKAKPTLGTLGSDGDEESQNDSDSDSGGGYLPFATASKDPAAAAAATTPKRQTFPTSPPAQTQPGKPTPPSRQDATTTTTTTTSSASSATSTSAAPPQQTTTTPNRATNALSPRQRANLASGSEGTGSPSMGSSFSDLDDASVTQSALEDALMSNMRAQGGSTMASRMSSLREALGRRV